MMKPQAYGRFGTMEELHHYEEQWHACTLMPGPNTLQSQVSIDVFLLFLCSSHFKVYILFSFCNKSG